MELTMERTDERTSELVIELVIDRVEGELAIVCAGGHTFEVPAALFGDKATEGRHFSLTCRPLPEREAEVRRQTGRRLADLAADDDGGDFSL